MERDGVVVAENRWVLVRETAPVARLAAELGGERDEVGPRFRPIDRLEQRPVDDDVAEGCRLVLGRDGDGPTLRACP
jgi:hypothetical protein